MTTAAPPEKMMQMTDAELGKWLMESPELRDLPHVIEAARRLAPRVGDDGLDTTEAEAILAEIRSAPPAASADDIAEVLTAHWVTGYGCDPEPRHGDRTRFHCWCGWSSDPCATVGDALQEWIAHALGYRKRASQSEVGELGRILRLAQGAADIWADWPAERLAKFVLENEDGYSETAIRLARAYLHDHAG